MCKSVWVLIHLIILRLEKFMKLQCCTKINVAWDKNRKKKKPLRFPWKKLQKSWPHMYYITALIVKCHWFRLRPNNQNADNLEMFLIRICRVSSKDIPVTVSGIIHSCTLSILIFSFSQSWIIQFFLIRHLTPHAYSIGVSVCWTSPRHNKQCLFGSELNEGLVFMLFKKTSIFSVSSFQFHTDPLERPLF